MPSLYLAPEMRRLALASQGWRAWVALLALALGVALGYGVHLVHAVAVAESEQAARRLAGEADLLVQSAEGDFDEALYPLLARHPEVAVASPVLEIVAKLPGRPERLRLLGVDIFQAARLQPALALPADSLADSLNFLHSERVFLNPAALAVLGLRPGERLLLQAGIGEVALLVAGSIDLPGRPLGVMDIAGAQTAFGRLGRLSRIELRWRAGVAPQRASVALAALLPPGMRIETPAVRLRQTAEFSRAYRVNLDLLALASLFAGGLLVFASQSLAVLRRRRQLALLRALGFSRREILGLLLAEAAILGLMGGMLGLLLGQGLAVALLQRFGADLGAAYFRGLAPPATADFAAAALFLGLGVAASLVGSLLPALEAARAAPARALRAGDEETLFSRRRSPWPGGGLLLLALAASGLPPLAGLPVFAYVAVALFLLGGIALLPWAVAGILATAARLTGAGPLAFQLALAQLRASAGQVSLCLAPLVASVAVATAMAIMVGSFRNSLEEWLDRLLPADLYLRAGVAGDSAFLPPAEQRRLAATPGVASIEFRRSRLLSLAPDKPAVTLLARRVDTAAPERSLPLVGPWRAQAGTHPAAWISEAMADLYGWQAGQWVELPLGNGMLRLQIAGLWRDYVRSGGAVVVDREAYVVASGDEAANEAAVWLVPGASREEVRRALVAAYPGGRVEVDSPAELKHQALILFERTFAATYALETAAVAVGLAGLSASFAALVLARRREFGVLRHLGLGRRHIGALLACQGLLLAAIALAAGFALGGVLSLLLVYVINRQSFHWSMDLAVPWEMLAIFAAAVLLLAAATAALSGRLAVRREAVLAVREDG